MSSVIFGCSDSNLFPLTKDELRGNPSTSRNLVIFLYRFSSHISFFTGKFLFKSLPPHHFMWCQLLSFVRVYNPDINRITPMICIGVMVSPRRYQAKTAVKKGAESSVRAIWLAFILFSPS